MRQKAVSSAPQNDAPIHTDVTSAAMPMLVEEVSTWCSALATVCSAAPGKILRRSRITLCSSALLSTIWPAMNSDSSASGRIDSSML